MVLILVQFYIAYWPNPFNLVGFIGVAHWTALRPAIAFVLIAVSLLLVLLSLPLVPVRKVVNVLVLPMLIFGLVSGYVVFDQGILGGGGTAETQGKKTVKVLSWNLHADGVSATEVASLIAEIKPDIVILPETTDQLANQISALSAQAGITLRAHTRTTELTSVAKHTSILLGSNFGDYSPTGPNITNRLSSYATTGSGEFTFYAVHAIAPMPNLMDEWQNDLEMLAAACNSPYTIMGGDLNAVYDHLRPHGNQSTFGNCKDAGYESHSVGIGTWPTSVPTFLGSSIDHILYGSGFELSDYQVITDYDSAGSDHRPITATLVIVGE